MHRVRMAVLENRLESLVLTDEDYRTAIELPSRGWLVEDDLGVAGFATGDSESGNIWALFVLPGREGRGYGRQLHDAMVAWMWLRGCPRLWLTTMPGTRAERFYLESGWRPVGRTGSGEIRFERNRPESEQVETVDERHRSMEERTT